MNHRGRAPSFVRSLAASANDPQARHRRDVDHPGRRRDRLGELHRPLEGGSLPGTRGRGRREGRLRVWASGPRTTVFVDDFEDGDLAGIESRRPRGVLVHEPRPQRLVDDADALLQGLRRGRGWLEEGVARLRSHVGGQRRVGSSRRRTGFVEHGVYDASDYAGVSFKAKSRRRFDQDYSLQRRQPT